MPAARQEAVDLVRDARRAEGDPGRPVRRVVGEHQADEDRDQREAGDRERVRQGAQRCRHDVARHAVRIVRCAGPAQVCGDGKRTVMRAR